MGLGVYKPDENDVVLASGPARRPGRKCKFVLSSERISRQGLGQVQVAFFSPKRLSPSPHSPSQLGAGRLDIHLQFDILLVDVLRFGEFCLVWTGLASEPSSILASCAGLTSCLICMSSSNLISCSNLVFCSNLMSCSHLTWTRS
jgi:hypothetical protein